MMATVMVMGIVAVTRERDTCPSPRPGLTCMHDHGGHEIINWTCIVGTKPSMRPNLTVAYPLMLTL